MYELPPHSKNEEEIKLFAILLEKLVDVCRVSGTTVVSDTQLLHRNTVRIDNKQLYC